jgi:hypothetical protein
MPRGPLLALLAALTLAACQMTLPFGGEKSSPPAALPGGVIEVTSLDAPPAEAAALTPVAAEDAPPAQDVAQEEVPLSEPTETKIDVPDAPPPPPKSDAQLRCERQGGDWVSNSNTALKTCVKPTGDGGKQCSRQTDCKGECLARSRTCAPISPLLGCNDILLADGTRTTQCIE